MEVAAVVSLRQGFGPMKFSAFVPVISFIHIAETRYKLKAVFPLAELADAAFGVGIVKLVHTLFILEFPVQLVR